MGRIYLKHYLIERILIINTLPCIALFPEIFSFSAFSASQDKLILRAKVKNQVSRRPVPGCSPLYLSEKLFKCLSKRLKICPYVGFCYCYSYHGFWYSGGSDGWGVKAFFL